MRELIGSWNGQTEVAQQTVIDGVDPSVNGDILRPVPSVLDYGCLANVDNLLNDVQLAEQIMALRRVAIARQSRRMLLLHVLHVAEHFTAQFAADAFPLLLPNCSSAVHGQRGRARRSDGLLSCAHGPYCGAPLRSA